MFPRKTKIQCNFNVGYAGQRLRMELLCYKPNKVKIVNNKPDISLEFLVGNPYTENRSDVIRRLEDDSIEKVYWLFYSCENDDTPMPEHFQKAKIITTFPSIKKEYPHASMIPLGADPNIFYPKLYSSKKYLVHTHGYDLRAESIQYVYQACEQIKKKHCHIGSDFDSLNHQANDILSRDTIDIFCDISDNEMNKRYNQSQYIACLRLIEGFEMPVVEGAMCGSMPIVYNLPCYKYWFKDFVTFIPFQGEPDKDGEPFGTSTERQIRLINSLIDVFSNNYELNDNQIRYVRNKFSWEKIFPKIWNKIIE